MIILLITFADTLLAKAQIPNELIEDSYKFCVKNNFSTDYCVFVDFSIPSGKNRFFVYCFSTKTIMLKSLCAQGTGEGFSNKKGSHCTSLGKYKIGNLRKMSMYPNKGFTLYGLEKSNSNALVRGILIHGGNFPFEIYPFNSPPISQGCFAVDNTIIEDLKSCQKYTKKPILLIAYK